jgi:subtilase family serine protease
MKRAFSVALVCAAMILVTACGGRSGNAALPPVGSSAQPNLVAGGSRVCNDTRPMHANCFVILGRPPEQTLGLKTSSTAPAIIGYSPAELQHVYNLDPHQGRGQLVAVVEAFGDPNLAADLHVYRKTFHLPTCNIANRCFRIIDQTGGTTYPAPDAGWTIEQSLDVDMVSANCPLCSIVVVQANSNSYADLAAAENEAASLNPIAISNSYGGPEFNDPAEAAAYNHPNIAITVSAGDNGYEVESPASFATVIAVGGTVLYLAPGAPRGLSETAWVLTGSGCSAYVPKPIWQHDGGCAMRTVADVAYDAAAVSGVAFYDSYPGSMQQIGSNWGLGAGTSVGAPAIAAIYGLRGQRVSDASSLYAGASSLFDITSGTNSNAGCTVAYLCTAEVGYDAPTGNGTPNTSAVF